MTKRILAVVDDMFFASKIRAVAESVGSDLVFTRSLDALIEKAREKRPDLIVVDLHNQKTSPISIAQQLRSDPELKDVHLLGFFSHVEVELQRQAKEAGYSQVLPRSVFARDLPSILGDVSQQ
jgi:CheY-like chemotaxis protein